MTDADGLDRDRVERLAVKMMRAVRDNYGKGPRSRDRVYEALNALAFAAVAAIKGCDDDAKAVWFFQEALTRNMSENAFPTLTNYTTD